jgi:hypothetical protein
MKFCNSRLGTSLVVALLVTDASESFVCPQLTASSRGSSQWSPSQQTYSLLHRGRTVLAVSDAATKLSEAPSSDREGGEMPEEDIAVQASSSSFTVTDKTAEVTILDSPVSKFRKLKDIMWVREALEDLTAADFACSVEESEREDTLGRKKKRAVDYEKLLSQLNRRVGDMICEPFEEVNGSEPKIVEDMGMGRFAYTQEQRLFLLE